ncbi:MAG: NFACT family protein [Clostridia bacterium]|nr:NFACT family protein [Clostridia bacterium]
MAFDASVIRCLTAELREKLLNARIDKIHQPQKDELVLVLRAMKDSFKLLLSVNPAASRLHLTEKKAENPSAPPMFCMFLRKHLSGGKITDIFQVDFERIIQFKIESYDELGDLTEKTLVVEIMGKHSNIILLNKDGVVMDSIKRIDISTSSVRQILPGLTYKLPPNDRLNPLESDFNPEILNSREPEKVLLSVYSGISPQLAAEILKNGYDAVISRIKNNEFSPVIIYKGNNPVDFAVIPVSVAENDTKTESVESISKALDTVYESKALSLLLNRLSAELVHMIHNNIDRCEKKLAIFKRQIQDAAKRETYRIKGELLTANLYRVQYGDTEITVDNYYDPNCEKITISLEPNLSPAKNAQKYYTKYNKAKTSEEQAYIQQKKTQKELNYLESVLDEILRAESPAEIAEIKEELRDEGYIRRDPNVRSKKVSLSKPLHFEIEGYDVFVGKNNRQNDELTLKFARSQDIWLHTKNIPGSHVIIQKKPNEEIPDTVIVKAAELAASHSKAKNAPKVPVDYTIVKNVKKPSGAKPGMVIYDHYNTIYVNL